jgi:hypothetical protein
MATLPSAGDLYSQAMNSIQGYGQSQKADLYQNYQNSVGQGMQSLASSGMAGTSVAPSMRMGYMKQYMQALNSLNDQLTKTKLGAQQTFGLGGLQSQQAQQGLDQSQQSINNQYTLGLGNLNLSRQQQNYDQQNRQQQSYQYASQQPAQEYYYPGSVGYGGYSGMNR